MGNRSRQAAEMLIAADVSQRFRGVLELGVVVAIVMLLMSLAMRSGESVYVRSQMTEAFWMSSTVRAEMIVYRAQHGRWPTESRLFNSDLNKEQKFGRYVDHMALNDNGSISVFFDAERSASLLRDRQVTFRPIITSTKPGSPIMWKCEMHRVSTGATPLESDNADTFNMLMPTACRDH